MYVNSVFEIPFDRLYEKGYRGLILDIDLTLVPHNADATPEIEILFQMIRAIGFKTVLLSDNSKERIERFNRNIGSDYIAEADKPNRAAYLQALKQMNLKPSETICIGDQILKDIYGAKRCGIASILVRYIGFGDGSPIGRRRRIEAWILKCYRRKRKGKKMFCDINPTCYKISQQKEICKRHFRNLIYRVKYPKEKSTEKYPVVVYEHHNGLIKTGKGIDPVLQNNKAVNIELAAEAMNGLLIKPGETFSFWKTVGKTTKRRGYRPGRVLVCGKLKPGVGGGLCNLANTLHLLVLHSPLTVTEFHQHSDALAPDPNGIRVPFSAGTSVNYNYVDYRFRNDTNQTFQICAWCEDNQLFAQLRAEEELPERYELVEQNHHFHKEGDKYYRISKIYRHIIDKQSGDVVAKRLVLDNHSEVLFDYNLIPKELIR